MLDVSISSRSKLPPKSSKNAVKITSSQIRTELSHFEANLKVKADGIPPTTFTRIAFTLSRKEGGIHI